LQKTAGATQVYSCVASNQQSGFAQKVTSAQKGRRLHKKEKPEMKKAALNLSVTFSRSIQGQER